LAVAEENETFLTLVDATLRSTDLGPSVTKTNDAATTYTHNFPFYLYAFIGEGSVGLVNSGCTDISAAAGPFVFLQEIVTATSENYACNGDGTGNINLAAVGGMPLYDSENEQFTVSVSGGATYTGNATIDNDENITITANNGVAWTVTFTDSQGCSADVTGTFVEANECAGCEADAGTPSFTPEYVCWGDDINLSVTGYTLGDETNGYVGLAISNVANIPNVAADFATASKYRVVAGESATFSNDASTFSTGEALYVYSFIGEGDANELDINGNCFDLSVAGPFVALNQMRINGSAGFNYDCQQDGTADVTLIPSGGLPAYDTD
jgi:hypothetical protein